MRHPAFVAGEYDTGFIEREPSLRAAPADAPAADAALVAASIDWASRGRNGHAQPGAAASAPAERPSAWRRSGSWRARF
jgi:hypothetical protein